MKSAKEVEVTAHPELKEAPAQKEVPARKEDLPARARGQSQARQVAVHLPRLPQAGESRIH